MTTEFDKESCQPKVSHNNILTMK